MKWVWASFKPGTMVRCWASMTRVLGPLWRITSSSVPMAKILPSATAKAEAVGCLGLRVAMRPLMTMVSALGLGASMLAQPLMEDRLPTATPPPIKSRKNWRRPK